MKTERKLCVVGIGALGAGGSSARALGAAAWAGVTPFRLASKEEMALGDDARLAASPLFDLSTPSDVRLAELLELALGEALPKSLPVRCKLHLALALPSWAQKPAIVRKLGQSFANVDGRLAQSAPGCALGNTAAGMRALLQSFELLFAVPPDEPIVVLWAGADTLIEPQLLMALQDAGLMSCKRALDGVVAGEGAAALALCTPEVARTLGLEILAVVQPPHVLSFEHPDGRASALSLALKRSLAYRAATKRASFAPEAKGAEQIVLSDGAFLAWRTEALARAVADNLPLLGAAQVIYTGALVGEVGAAFAPMALVLALFGCRHGLTQGPFGAIACADGQWTGALAFEALWQPSIFFVDGHTASQLQIPDSMCSP